MVLGYRIRFMKNTMDKRAIHLVDSTFKITVKKRVFIQFQRGAE
jgi:hypothetical protein